ncbi:MULTISPECIES: DUF134 domain-containing protein [Ectothiorhodospira]|uniref:DUF134 domain-containing protein n=1 Tax=Ectothiorhodospira TaxID=1051 RepID=UPI00024A8745|nr:MULTISPECIES: DUF134 domain-containing protein [Ectothiorhodospira]EHQ51227.1 DNA-binding protein [Ectothiorhodospira sp. PHS-1]MBK1671758.1 DUF134 domain-containing protein [Ectothiorhodospira shaposhnikovii]MCG5513080.1 DUF134 domain-containing protein [Ectothiorhodospira shaposhnikovii]
MPRPRGPRRITCRPDCTYFKPAGIPLRDLEEVVLALEEVEALRLADLEGRYQADAADSMGVSRSTFSRMLDSARKKVSEALLQGKAIRIEMADTPRTGPPE